jgi:hypothetical protein
MPRWEYLVVRVEYHTVQENVTVRAVNDQEVRDRNTALPAFLNQLGGTIGNWSVRLDIEEPILTTTCYLSVPSHNSSQNRSYPAFIDTAALDR